MNIHEFADYLRDPDRQVELAVEYNSYGVPVHQYTLCITRRGDIFIGDGQQSIEGDVITIDLPEGVDANRLADFINSQQFITVMLEILENWNHDGITYKAENLVDWIKDAVSEMNSPFHVWSDISDWWEVLWASAEVINKGQSTIEKEVNSITKGQDILIDHTGDTVIYTRRRDIESWLRRFVQQHTQ